ncbi:MAG: glycosyltransferase family 4 protein [Chitinophagaceae bacterium]|nr:glycosyltransferase family 4 protein [Chitinophagaceae bacterium]
MKILIITETLHEGGAELFVLRLARALRAAGEDAEVLCFHRKSENRVMTAMYADIPIKRLSLPLISLIDFGDKLLAKLKVNFTIKYFLIGLIIKKRFVGRYDIFHSNYIQADYCIDSIKRKNSFKHIITIHGDYSAFYDQFIRGELRFWLRLDNKLKRLATGVDRWVIISEEQRQFLRNIMNVPDGKIAKIYNGFEPAAIQDVQITKNNFTIGMVSRGVEKKGWQILIDVFLKLPENTRLILVGGGEYMDQLKAKYVSEKRITFTGFQLDPLQWLVQMHVFVLPTLFPFESLPTVVIEALYCGLPVIATKLGDIENMITDENTDKKAGFVIDFDGKNLDKIQLYERLKYLYDNPEVIYEMKNTAKAAFQKFQMGKSMKSYRQEYKKLLY